MNEVSGACRADVRKCVQAGLMSVDVFCLALVVLQITTYLLYLEVAGDMLSCLVFERFSAYNAFRESCSCYRRTYMFLVFENAASRATACRTVIYFECTGTSGCTRCHQDPSSLKSRAGMTFSRVVTSTITRRRIIRTPLGKRSQTEIHD